VRSGALDVIVIDSVAALTPRARSKVKWATPRWVPGAVDVPGPLRKLAAAIRTSKTCCASSPTSCARRSGDVWKSRDDHRRKRPKILRVGSPGHPADRGDQGRPRASSEPHPGEGGSRNKVAPPFKEALFDIIYNEGISRMGDLIEHGRRNTGIIERAGPGSPTSRTDRARPRGGAPALAANKRSPRKSTSRCARSSTDFRRGSKASPAPHPAPAEKKSAKA